MRSVPCVQRRERVSPTARACPVKKAISRERRTGPRTKGFIDSVVTARAACREPCHIRSGSIPSRATSQESESSSGRTRATGIAPPGFYGVKPWMKAKQQDYYFRSGRRAVRSCRPPPESVHKSSQRTLCPGAPATATTVRGCIPARPAGGARVWPSLSACPTGRSSAS